MLEWVAISSLRGSSLPRDCTCVSCISCLGHLGQNIIKAASWKNLRVTFSFVVTSCLPRWRSGKESAFQGRRSRRGGCDPWVGKIPWSEEMATRFSILAWKITRTEEPGGLQSMGSQRVGSGCAHSSNQLSF